MIYVRAKKCKNPGAYTQNNVHALHSRPTQIKVLRGNFFFMPLEYVSSDLKKKFPCLLKKFSEITKILPQNLKIDKNK